MAQIAAFRNNALPYPVYGAPWVVVFPLLDADGDPVTGATCDSEVSLNGDTAADCTNEGTEIPFDTATNKGMYYLSLTTAEMTADIVAVTIYSATSKATCLTLYPRKLVAIRSGTAAGGDTTYITLDASANATNDFYNGMVCVATINGNVEVRVISDYTGSSKQAGVTPAWNVAPESDDTFVIYLPEGHQVQQANMTLINGAAADGTETINTNVTEVADTSIMGAGTQVGVAFEKFFNVATPTGTVNSLPDAVPGEAGGVFIAGSNAATTFASLTITAALGVGTNFTVGGNFQTAGYFRVLGVTELSGGVTVSDAIATAGITTGAVTHSSLLVSGTTTLTGAVSAPAGITANITGTVSGNSVHNAAAVVTALGTGTTLTAIPWNEAWDAEVQSECDDAITASTLIQRIMPGIAGTVTNAGTGTEVFVYGAVTMTVTVDDDGNRSAVEWS